MNTKGPCPFRSDKPLLLPVPYCLVTSSVQIGNTLWVFESAVSPAFSALLAKPTPFQSLGLARSKAFPLEPVVKWSRMVVRVALDELTAAIRALLDVAAPNMPFTWKDAAPWA